MIHPSFAPVEKADDFLRILPVYRYKKGLSSRDWRSFMSEGLKHIPEDFFFQEDLEEWGLLSLEDTLTQMHFPTDREMYSRAKYRLIFEEFFRFLLQGKESERRQATKISLPSDSVNTYASTLPFPLTRAQLRTLEEIKEDFSKGRMMRRLLQGDVGSGKSIVAYYPMTQLAKLGMQSAYLAPTDILARQQFENFCALFPDIPTRFLSASTKDKEAVYDELREAKALVVIGTHALLQEGVAFSDLRLVVTDEQHRFGVAQREQLHRKGREVHLLQMSATPIPRTLSLLLFGNMDQSILDEKPPGRYPIETRLISPVQLPDVYEQIKSGFATGEKAYIVFPAIEENENASMASLESEETMLKKVFGEQVAFLHGRMPAKEKEQILETFRTGEKMVLAATTLIEVGMDIPEATRLLLRSAQQFGLSQIHQIRGRIGRNNQPATCYLCAESAHIPERLEILVREEDGFKIAEEDLRLRGPGEIRGLRQHGDLDFEMADVIRHEPILRRVHDLLDEATAKRYRNARKEQKY
ncbi:MAG TPA: DEAD/DEAH box helicase [Tissierellia bacterium]|nr:DEAD/DEAH box helicase [Tissierellia bacterium]